LVLQRPSTRTFEPLRSALEHATARPSKTTTTTIRTAPWSSPARWWRAGRRGAQPRVGGQMADRGDAIQDHDSYLCDDWDL